MIKYLGVVLEGEKTQYISLCGKGHTVNGKVLSKRKHATIVGTKKRGQSNRESNSSRGQCSGSMIFWYRSGSADPYFRLTDPAPTPNSALFVSDLQDGKKIFLLRLKVVKKSQIRKNQRFSYYVLLDYGRIRIRIHIRTSG
jgi:hypothetical protein